MDKYYYKYEENSYILKEICPCAPIMINNEVSYPKIGSAKCNKCSNNIEHNSNERYIVCKYIKKEQRRKKLEKL